MVPRQSRSHALGQIIDQPNRARPGPIGVDGKSRHGLGYHQAHPAGSRKGIALHVVHMQGQVSQGIGSPQALIRLVPPSVQVLQQITQRCTITHRHLSPKMPSRPERQPPTGPVTGREYRASGRFRRAGLLVIVVFMR